MSSDNPSGADNQQERPSSSNWLDGIPSDVGHYVAGFVDGEAASTCRSVAAVIVVSHGGSRCRSTSRRLVREAPSFLHHVFEVGTVRGRGDGVFYFEVTRPAELQERVFPFFERFPLRGAKAADLAVFREITELVQSGRHLLVAGVTEVLALRAPMNRGGKRRRSDEEIIAALRSWESSEAIRRAPSLKPRDEDMVHAP
jgi:hypothetical protein